MISAAATNPQNCLNTLVNEVIAGATRTPAGKVAVPIAEALPINPNKKKVLFVTSELADLVKTGGLGDVSAALPRAMRHLHDVRVLIPGYPQVMNSDNPIHVIGELGGHAALPPCKIGRMDLKDGLVIYVLICPELYEREGTPYGANNGRDWPDNHIRFARLGLAAADIAANLAQIHWQPDLVHAHDWPAGLAPAYMHWRGQRTPTEAPCASGGRLTKVSAAPVRSSSVLAMNTPRPRPFWSSPSLSAPRFQRLRPRLVT